jgi:cytochrome c553
MNQRNALAAALGSLAFGMALVAVPPPTQSAKGTTREGAAAAALAGHRVPVAAGVPCSRCHEGITALPFAARGRTLAVK